MPFEVRRPYSHNLITRLHVGSRPRLLEFFFILGVPCQRINHGLSAEVVQLLH